MAIDISHVRFPSLFRRGKEADMFPDTDPTQAGSDATPSQNGHAEQQDVGASAEFDPLKNSLVGILEAVAGRKHEEVDFLSEEASLCLRQLERLLSSQEQ